MRKRLLLALAALTIAGLAGCGIKDDAFRTHTDNRYLLRVRAEIPTLADQTDTELLAMAAEHCRSMKEDSFDRDDFAGMMVMFYGDDEEFVAEQIHQFDLAVEYFCPAS